MEKFLLITALFLASAEEKNEINQTFLQSHMEKSSSRHDHPVHKELTVGILPAVVFIEPFQPAFKKKKFFLHVL